MFFRCDSVILPGGMALDQAPSRSIGPLLRMIWSGSSGRHALWRGDDAVECWLGRVGDAAARLHEFLERKRSCLGTTRAVLAWLGRVSQS